MFNVVLVAPEIPPNTGNVIRLCANTGCRLHLIEPLGFELDDSRLRRAGLDYHEFASVRVFGSFVEFVERCGAERLFMFSKFHRRLHADANFQPNDSLVFGSETSGLPESVRTSVGESFQVKLPMVSGNRSLNLSNAVAVSVYEAWRQNGFRDVAEHRPA